MTTRKDLSGSRAASVTGATQRAEVPSAGSAPAPTRAKGRKRKPSPHRSLLQQNRHRYEDILKRQGGHCALCPAKPVKRKLDLDHDHKRMVIRGALCHRCNRALPAWMTRDWLLRAADYIEGTA